MAQEIERKFLIQKVDCDYLMSLGAVKKEIEQTYLKESKEFPVRRIRKVIEGNKTTYFYTQKRKSSGTFSREEVECEIDINRYLELQKERDLELNIISKTRYVLTKNNLNYEFDIFPFFDKFDILEIELPSEDSVFELPSFVSVIKEVTLDFSFTNNNMARRIPNL